MLDGSRKKICFFLNYVADANIVADKIGDLTKLDILV